MGKHKRKKSSKIKGKSPERIDKTNEVQCSVVLKDGNNNANPDESENESESGNGNPKMKTRSSGGLTAEEMSAELPEGKKSKPKGKKIDDLNDKITKPADRSSNEKSKSVHTGDGLQLEVDTGEDNENFPGGSDETSSSSDDSGDSSEASSSTSSDEKIPKKVQNKRKI